MSKEELASVFQVTEHHLGLFNIDFRINKNIKLTFLNRTETILDHVYKIRH